MRRTRYMIESDEWYEDGVSSKRLRELTNSFVWNHTGDHFCETVETFDTAEDAVKSLDQSKINVCQSYYFKGYHVVMTAYEIIEVIEEYDEDSDTWDVVEYGDVIATSEFYNPYKTLKRDLYYTIEDNTGIVIEEVNTLEKAKELMKEFVEQDEADGYTDTDSWYEIYEYDYDDDSYINFITDSKGRG